MLYSNSSRASHGRSTKKRHTKSNGVIVAPHVLDANDTAVPTIHFVGQYLLRSTYPSLTPSTAKLLLRSLGRPAAVCR